MATRRTFGSASSQFTPSALTNSGQTPRIAAFFADVDTRAGNSVTYGTGTVDNHPAFAASKESQWSAPRSAS